jgi:hypothetical protein
VRWSPPCAWAMVARCEVPRRTRRTSAYLRHHATGASHNAPGGDDYLVLHGAPFKKNVLGAGLASLPRLTTMSMGRLLPGLVIVAIALVVLVAPVRPVVRCVVLDLTGGEGSRVCTILVSDEDASTKSRGKRSRADFTYLRYSRAICFRRESSLR